MEAWMEPTENDAEAVQAVLAVDAKSRDGEAILRRPTAQSMVEQESQPIIQLLEGGKNTRIPDSIRIREADWGSPQDVSQAAMRVIDFVHDFLIRAQTQVGMG
jgi:hypothetical protein